MRPCFARSASHVPTRGPIIPLGRPPAPPAPAKQASFPSSTPTSKPTASFLPKTRLDYNRLLSDPSGTTRNHLLRGSPLGPDHVAHIQRLRETQKQLLHKLQTIRAKQRDVSELIKTKIGDTDEALRQAKKLKVRVGEYEATLAETEGELLELALALPNFSHPAVPPGPEENAIVLDTFGPQPVPADPNRDHLRVATHFGLVDNEASTVASGSSWPFLKGALALLEMALINHALFVAVRHGYTPVVPPDVIKADLAWRCGFAPRDERNGPQQTYSLVNHGGEPTHVLAGTAEIPLSALFANRILLQSALPQKVVGVGHAFRAEAGARGADTRGLYRVHQFTKVELFCVSTEKDSEQMMETMRAVQKEIVQGLGLSVRVLDMPTEELGASAARKFDMEAWMPGRGKWGEITSTSNCTDYQSRRLHIRYRPSAPTPSHDASLSNPQSSQGDALPFAHTLNGTAAAIPRLLVALLENGVRLGEKGEVEGLDLPEALRRFWIGGDDVGEGKEKAKIRWV